MNVKKMSEQLAQQIIQSCGKADDPYAEVWREDLALQLKWFAEEIIMEAKSESA